MTVDRPFPGCTRGGWNGCRRHFRIPRESSQAKYQERRFAKCPEEMEPGPKVKDLEPVQGREEAGVGAVAVGQALAETASARTAAKRPLTSGELPSLSTRAPNAGRL
jgi:hypothetical protein